MPFYLCCFVFQQRNFDKDAKTDYVFTRFSVKYFSKVISALSVKQKEVIGRSCFASLLQFDWCFVPNHFASWIANHVDVKTCDIIVNDKVIPMSKESVNIILGLPVGGTEISSNFEAGKKKFLEVFGLTTMPPVKFFGDKLSQQEDMIDDQILFCFIIVSLNCFLCPNSCSVPSRKYLSVFEDIEAIDNFDWSKLIFDWLMDHLKKLNRSKSLDGCFFCLAVSLYSNLKMNCD